MSGRQIIVVDTETTGLDPDIHVPVEVAWWNLTTDERARFIPRIAHVNIVHADAKALEINGYLERIEPHVVGRSDEEATKEDKSGFAALAKVLHGNTFAGSNPSFDARMLSWSVIEGWHHRLLDLSAYAAGVLSIPPTALPGLEAVCKELGITNEAPHTAAGDVDATGRCFLALMEIAGRNAR